MDLQIRPEVRLKLQALRKYINVELRPLESTVERNKGIGRHDWDKLVTGAGNLGLKCYNAPSEIGGPGLSLVEQAAVAEELGRTSQALAEFLLYLPESILECDQIQKARYLESLLINNKEITIALTEESGGSVLDQITTEAKRTTAGWVLNGKKKFITRGDTADYVIVLARTGNEGVAHKDLSAFIVEKGTVGFSGEPLTTMGWWGESLAELTFNNCEVGRDTLVGTVGEGLRILMRGVTGTRLRVAGKCVGVIGDLLDTVVPRVLSRRVSGGVLADLDSVRSRLADIQISWHAARALLYEAAVTGDKSPLGHRDRNYRTAVSRAKIYATEAAWHAVDVVLQLFGAAGYTTDTRIERIYRDVRAYRLGEGTSEILRLDVAREVLAATIYSSTDAA